MDSRRYSAIVFTFHAVHRMAQRKISADAAERAIQEGTLRPGDGETILAEVVEGDSTIRIVFVEVRDDNQRTARIITAIRIGKR